MPDKYTNFAQLAAYEVSGVDYRILLRQARTSFAIVAPHGGGIEPGTSELANAIAGEELSMYDFDGLKRSGNADLHITSTNFDEPIALSLVRRCQVVVTMHGEESEIDGEGVFVGGRNTELGELLGAALAARNFPVGRHPDPRLQGLERSNICNRGATRRGVQFEISRSIRREMFSSLSREGRKCTTTRFADFVAAMSSVLLAQSGKARAARSTK